VGAAPAASPIRSPFAQSTAGIVDAIDARER